MAVYCFAGGIGAGFIDGASDGAPAGGAGGKVRWPVVADGRVVSCAVRSPSPPMPNAKIKINTTTEMPAIQPYMLSTHSCLSASSSYC